MSSTTRTKTDAGPPQLMPEGAPGYGMAQGFYQGQLAQPSVYQGQRYSPPGDLEYGAYEQGRGVFGGPRGEGGQAFAPDYRYQGSGELAKTLGGNWMNGPEQQAAIQSGAAPIFERFENQTMPGIRDRAQFSGQGVQGNRRSVAETNAAQELGQSLATGVVAPIYQGERERMTRQSIEGTQGILGQDIARTNQMMQLGEQGRQLGEHEVAANRDRYEEMLARQGSAAESLIAAATTGPGGSSSAYNPSVMRMILGSGKA